VDRRRYGWCVLSVAFCVALLLVSDIRFSVRFSESRFSLRAFLMLVALFRLRVAAEAVRCA